MSAAAILVIVVAAGEAQDPATAIMLAAAAESLGANVAVRLVDARAPQELDPLLIERDLGAGAVVTLVWRDADRLRARMRLHVAAGGRSTTRDLTFSASDTRAERGRTLGLAAAAMWPEIAASRAAAPPTRGPPAAPPAGPPPPPPPLVIRGEGPAAPRAGERASVRAARFGLGLAAVGATGVGGPAGGLGARIEAVLPVATSWSLRLGLGLRRGSIPELPGTDLAGALAGGVEWWPGGSGAGRVARLGVRADALILRHQVSGAVIPGQSEDRGRFLPGVDLLAQAAVRVSARVDLVAAAGGEAALGNTAVRSGETPVTVATIPALRLTAEMGLRVGF